MKRASRRGITLIEMTVVIALTAALALACAVLLSSLSHLDRAERIYLIEAVALDQLTFEFRRDVREAIKAETVDRGVDLIRPDGTIVSYRFDKARVFREEIRDESPVRRDLFRLTPQARASWEKIDDNGVRMLRMSIVFGSNNAMKRYPFRVVAALGASKRFETEESYEDIR